jgi:hypothetical protein
VTPKPSALLFDCIPTGMLPETPSIYEPFFGSYTEAEIEAGRAQMGDAVAEFLVRKPAAHELLITHNAVIAWFVREVLDAPDWRWMTINQAHCGLTVLASARGAVGSRDPQRPRASADGAAYGPARGSSGLSERGMGGDRFRGPASAAARSVVRVHNSGDSRRAVGTPAPPRGSPGASRRNSGVVNTPRG